MSDHVTFTPPRMRTDFDPQGDRKNPYVVVGVHRFDNTVASVEVPDGFRCDLASVPAGLLWLCPPTGLHQRAALFHDAAYRQQKTDRAMADAIFRTIMRRDKVPAWRRELMYFAVRLFGGRAWKQNETRVHSTRVAMKGSRCS